MAEKKLRLERKQLKQQIAPKIMTVVAQSKEQPIEGQEHEHEQDFAELFFS